MPDTVDDTTAGDTADNRSSTPAPGVVGRRIAPFAPLAIALLAQSALIGTGTATAPTDHNADTAAVCEEEIPSYQECHSEYPTGCSKAAGYDGYLNFLKNQLVSPDKARQLSLAQDDYGKLELGLPQDLAKSNHEQFKNELAALGEGHVVSLTGYLYYAKKGGKESSNCQLTEPTDIDFHIGIGFDPDLAAKLEGKKKLTTSEHTQVDQSSVIVEMTPHWRAQFKPAWTLEALAPAVGHQVRVTGQLLVDNEHYDPKDDCGLSGAGASCWRASVWELHPVTGFQVCGSDSCDETSTDWVDLEDFGTGTVASSSPASTPSSPAPAAASSTTSTPARR